MEIKKKEHLTVKSNYSGCKHASMLTILILDAITLVLMAQPGILLPSLKTDDFTYMDHCKCDKGGRDDLVGCNICSQIECNECTQKAIISIAHKHLDMLNMLHYNMLYL